MTLYAVHYAWVEGHATKAPVGIWASADSSYYPPQFDELRNAGAAVQNPAMTWSDWVEMRTEYGSTYGPSWGGVDADAPMAQVLADMQEEFFSQEHPVRTFTAADPVTSGERGEKERSAGLATSVGEPVPAPEPAGRFVRAQAWWIASELCRRSAQLRIVHTKPLGGFYEGLEVGRPGDDRHAFLNFVGRIHVHRGQDEGVPITWAQTFAVQSPHEVVKALEAALGWAHKPADPTTARSLTYRVLADCLWRRVNDRATWVVQEAVWSSATSPEWVPQADVGAFLPDFDGALDDIGPGPDPGQLAGVWVLERAGARSVVLSDRGRLYRRGGMPLDLLVVYQRRHVLSDVTDLVLQAADAVTG